MQTSAKKACFQFAERSLFYAKIPFSNDTCKSVSWIFVSVVYAGMSKSEEIAGDFKETARNRMAVGLFVEDGADGKSIVMIHIAQTCGSFADIELVVLPYITVVATNRPVPAVHTHVTYVATI